jgi:hypothetical protein
MAGRHRWAEYRFFLLRAERIEDTELTALYRRLVGDPPPPVWHTVNRFGSGSGHSPNYLYHTALDAVARLMQALNMPCFSDATRRTAALTFLDLLQKEARSGAASDYAEALLNLAHTERGPDPSPLDPEDLPPPKRTTPR